MSIITAVHRYLGETLLLVALVGVVLAAIGLVRKRTLEKPEHIFGLVYSGLLDLQALLGLIQFVHLLLLGGTGLVASRFILHPLLMILAVVVVHVTRIWRDGPIPTRHRVQLAAYGLSLVLVFAGRMILA